jgi:hypothetical protein
MPREEETMTEAMWLSRKALSKWRVHINVINYVNMAESLARYVARFSLGYYSTGKGKKELIDHAHAVLFGEVSDFPDFAFSYVRELSITQV